MQRAARAETHADAAAELLGRCLSEHAEHQRGAFVAAEQQRRAVIVLMRIGLDEASEVVEIAVEEFAIVPVLGELLEQCGRIDAGDQCLPLAQGFGVDRGFLVPAVAAREQQHGTARRPVRTQQAQVLEAAVVDDLDLRRLLLRLIGIGSCQERNRKGQRPGQPVSAQLHFQTISLTPPAISAPVSSMTRGSARPPGEAR